MGTRNIIVGQRVDAAKVQRAKEMRRGMTEGEQILWQALRAQRARGFLFRRQQVIDGFIVDFDCHRAGLVVEVDGPYHEKQPDSDAERDQVLSGRGLHVLRVTNDSIKQDLSAVIAQITQVADERTSPPPRAGEPRTREAGGGGRGCPHTPPPRRGEGVGGRGPSR
jgi:very-short-patch-repair endonuclease